MPEPMTITAASLVALCANVTKTIVDFVREVRGARKDLLAVCDELSSLRMTLDTLCDDCKNPDFEIPQNLENNLTLILNNCNKTVTEIEAIITNLLGSGVRGKFEWTLKVKEDVAKLRVNLEAHKMSLGLVLDMIDMTITRHIKQDTTEIKETTSVIQTELRDGHAKILEKMETLRVQATMTPATMTKPSSSHAPELAEATKVRTEVITRKEVFTQQPSTTEARDELRHELWKLLRELNEEHNGERIGSQQYCGEIRSVLQRGVDPNATDEVHSPKRNWTPLHEVCFFGNAPQLVEILLEFGANANVADNRRRTPLHMCSASKQVEKSERIAKSLISSGGADVNARDYYGSTPLNTMTYLYTSLNLLALLVESGADVNAADKEGRVPLARAIAYGQKHLVAYLIQRGANVHVKDKYGRSVLEVARQGLEAGMLGDGSGFLKPEILDFMKQYGLLLFQG